MALKSVSALQNRSKVGAMAFKNVALFILV